MPQNADAERSVLGAILLDNHALKPAIEKLSPGDFALKDHQRIFTRMIQMGQSQQVIDLVTLTDQLHRNGELDTAGGAAYLAQLVDGVPRVMHLEHYATIVKEKAMLRRLIETAHAIKQEAFEARDNSEQILQRAADALTAVRANCSLDWRGLFHSVADFEKAPSLRMAISQLVQLDSATAWGALAGHGKTWIQLIVAGAMLQGAGTKLWGQFEVLETIPRVLYLIPESTLGPFAHRVRTLGLLRFVENERLLVRTLSMGPRPILSDPRILRAAQGSYVMLDTLARFSDGSDENSASEFQVLASDILGLMGAGALGVSAAHHAPKAFAGTNVMSLEAVLRGTGDIGAVFATVFGIKQLDAERNIVHIENVKARDFEPPKPFQLIGRPYISEVGDFEIHKAPGECGPLHDEQQPERDRGGAPKEAREGRAANLELLRQMLTVTPSLTSQQISQRFAEIGIKLGDSAIRKYRKELGV